MIKNKKVICVDRDGKKKEVDSSELFFRPSVYGILIENNKILLSKQWDGYDFPGGGMDIYETIDEALEREFLEETGVEVKRGKIVLCENNFFTAWFSKKSANFITMYYLVEKVGGEFGKIKLEEDEKKYVGPPEWVDLDKIEKIKFHNNVDSVDVIKKAIELLK